MARRIRDAETGLPRYSEIHLAAAAEVGRGDRDITCRISSGSTSGARPDGRDMGKASLAGIAKVIVGGTSGEDPSS
jgi:hypothetical protein